MKVIMPTGMSHGWGIAGHYLTEEISKLPPLPGVVLQSVGGSDFMPIDSDIRGEINICYSFFEDEIEAYRHIPEVIKNWNFMVAGSTWCEYHLRIAGVKNTATILQGVDHNIFYPHPPLQDDSKFIVFSGGKFEFRKSQDIVIAAMKVFMERHNDVWLAAAWHNSWIKSIHTMEQSNLINFRYEDIQQLKLYEKVLRNNGIDMNRVVLYPCLQNSEMVDAYKKSHIGLFPNRCEGGNNMVMCEYMACGRTVIASNRTGHADVLTNNNAYCLTHYEPVISRNKGKEFGVWFEADVAELIDMLEFAYQNRDINNQKGVVAANDMQKLLWSDAAKKFHKIAEQYIPPQELQKTEIKSVANLIDEANAFFRSNQFDAAKAVYEKLLAQLPFDPDLHNSIATVLDAQERYAEAVAHYNKALTLKSDFWIARFNLANTIKRMGDIATCKSHLQIIVEGAPDFQPAWQNLASLYFDEGNLTESAKCLEKILTLDPEWILAWNDLGEVYHQMGGADEKAIACYERIIANKPDYASAYNSKGLILLEQGDCKAAEKCYKASISLVPDDYFVMSNLGLSLLAQAEPEQAIEWFNKALELEIGSPTTRFNRALALLSIGDFKNGWEDYECRFNKIDPVYLPPIELPTWNGENLNGKTIIVRMEQGYGDCIQCMRFLPLLKERGCKIILECIDDTIKSLFLKHESVDATYIRREQVPVADFQVPFFSLPRIFGINDFTIPFPEGYLKPDSTLLQYWKDVIDKDSLHGSYKIGIVWGGRKTRLNANRSLKLDDLTPLFAIHGITWFSLQVGADKEQLESYQSRIIDLGNDFITFADTAAAIQNLDLVITIDTSVAHLCGALGVNTSVLLKSSPDWRWRLKDGKTLWYSSVTQYRQPEPGDWVSVIKNVAEKLNLVVTQKKLKFATAKPDT